jgi:Fe2+ or Zn2+ uptake regulation protein
MSDDKPILAIRRGHKIRDDQDTRTVGERGPAKPEPVVHARGTIARGYFESLGTTTRKVRASGGGRSLPRNYQLLRELVESEPGRHWTANEVYLEARKRRPKIGYTTVHRGLIRLCELETLMKIETPGGEAAWYEPATQPHAHLLCVDCQGIVDVDYHTSKQMLAVIAAGSGLEISEEIVTFRGRCPPCVARRAAIQEREVPP